MSVGEQLGLDDDSVLLDQARESWPHWVALDSRLAVVENFDDLRLWLSTVPREKADEVLLALAILAASDGGDDVAAAAALAKCLLPGACRLAGWLSSLPPRDVFHDSQPVQAGAWSVVERIDELVASQLWLEVRTFAWRRRTKVAANIIMDTRVGVLLEVGNYFQVSRADRAWAQTHLLESFSTDEHHAIRGIGAGGRSNCSGVQRGPCGDGLPSPVLTTPDPAEASPSSAAEELLELLALACAIDVISATDRRLLLFLVQEAEHVQVRNVGRGYGGLIGNELSRLVAPRIGVSEATVRRHASRSVQALAAAAASGRLSHVG